MSPLALVGLLVIATSALADVKHVLEGSAHPPDPNSISPHAVNYLAASTPNFWWMDPNSPLKAAYDHYKKCNTKGNCRTPPAAAAPNPLSTPAPAPFRPQPSLTIDIKNNPFFNGNYQPSSSSSSSSANTNYNKADSPLKIDISKNPFLSGGVVTSSSGTPVVKDGQGFLGVQPSQPFAAGRKPGFATTHPLEQKKQPLATTGQHSLGQEEEKDDTSCKGAGRVCVSKEQCVNGVVNKNGEGILQFRSDIHFCDEGTQVCCRLRDLDDVTVGKSSVPVKVIGAAAGFSPAIVQPFSLKPDVVFSGEQGQHSGSSSSSTPKSVRQTPDFSDVQFDSNVRFASTFQGPGYLPPVAPTTPKPPPRPFNTQPPSPSIPVRVQTPSINQQFVSRPSTPKYVPPSPTTPRPLPPVTTPRPAPPTTTFRPAPSTSREYLPPRQPSTQPSTLRPYQPPSTTQRPYQPPPPPPSTTQRPYRPPPPPPSTTQRPYQPPATTQRPYQPPSTTQRPYQPPSTTQRPYQPTTPRPTPPPSYPTGGYSYPKPTPTFGYPTPGRQPDISGSDINNQYVQRPTPGYLPPSSTPKPVPNVDQSVDSSDVNAALRPLPSSPGENVAPPAGCAAALKCVQEIYCTAEGVVSPVPVVLTKQQEENRVPLTVCQDKESGITGKCCRDPNYKDPWPSANLVDGFDDGQYREDDSIGQYQTDLQRNVRSDKAAKNFNKQQPQAKCGERHQGTSPQGPGPLDVNFAEIPWQAMVLRDTNRSLLCGGVIIRHNAVLTAAHCVQGLETSDILIKGGEWKLGIDEEPLPFQIVKVAAVVRHPQYQPGSLVNDLAILLLEEKLRPAKNVGTLCLPPANQIPTQNCIATGWGKRILQLHAKGAIMHSIGVKVMDNGQCQETLSSTFQHALANYSPNTLCGYSDVDQCRVDYGSALACHNGKSYVLSGIYSWDTGCKQQGQIGGYIAPDVEWVESTLAQPVRELKKLQQRN